MEIAGLTRVATYRRSIGASIERVWENVLDWEHLPWLHASSFCAVERIDSGPWGWRVHVDLPPVAEPKRTTLELLVEREASRYVARTTEGVGKGTEIWTQLRRTGEHTTDIEVDFCVADVAPGQANGLGAAYAALYARLWDEDEAMMIRRTAQLENQLTTASTGERLELGRLDAVRARAPFAIEFEGWPFRVVAVDGDLLVHSTICPHRLGPLDETDVEAGRVTCPWHGYRFDLRSGRSCDGHGLRLAPAPQLEVDQRTSRVCLITARAATS